MSANGKDRARLVHEVRKTIKRMRAMARLLRCEIGEQEFERVNTSLRDAGKRLAGARDAEVRLATLLDLRSRHPRALADEQIDLLVARLERERARVGAPELELDVLADIAEMRGDLLRWDLLDHDFDALAQGLRLVYRDGRRRYRRVERGEGRDPDTMHDWRKRVKSLYYALDMLGGAQADETKGITRRADRLGEKLGGEHDLWMLASYVQDDSELLGEDGDVRVTLLALIERRRELLRGEALKLGERLYRRRPRRFVARVGRSLSR
jgi:CHAD domain-containing protein